MLAIQGRIAASPGQGCPCFLSMLPENDLDVITRLTIWKIRNQALLFEHHSFRFSSLQWFWHVFLNQMSIIYSTYVLCPFGQMFLFGLRVVFMKGHKL